MIVKRAIMILLCLLLLVGSVTAEYASGNSFNPVDPMKIWIIADDVGQQNVIKLTAKNSTSGLPVKNAPVTFTLDSSLLGTVTPVSTATDNNGEALCTFTVNTTHPTSGTARIAAEVISTEDLTGATYHTILNWDQKIDHNVPYKAVFDYSNEGAVESVMPFKISVFDRWDNKVDDRFETEKSIPPHSITLHINGPSPPNNCGFTDFGMVHDKQINLLSNGEVTISVTPATKPGWHYFRLEALGSMPEQMKMFKTVASGVPFSMTQDFSPDGLPYATVLADGISQFNFHYTLLDKYGNPTQDQKVWINTSVPGEESLRSSLEEGQIWSTYGPKSYTGLFTIYATPVGNPSLQLSKEVRFYNTSPSNIDLTANPQSMPSRDANPSIYSNITAKVTDIMGNGAAGETVTFTFHDVTNTPAAAATTAAYVAPSFSKTSILLTTSGITDADGYATVKFYPGSYAIANQPGYLQAVTGTAKVTAGWNGQEKDEPVMWKNYPYLSAVVAVKPQQVKVGETVDVSIKLNGDGWALYQYPIDVNLVLDRSGSMGWDVNGVNGGTPTRLLIAQSAANTFIGKMSPARDRAGLWSYGYDYDVAHNAVLQSPFGPVTTAVSGIGANGATGTRAAVKNAIADMIATPNANTKAVRAVIVMTDGDWNNAGSPAAHGTGWPAGNPDYTFSGNTLEPNNYRYYSGLGGTLTGYGSSTTCDVCASDYTAGSGGQTGKCQWTSGAGFNNLYYTPASKPSSCTTPRPLTKCTDGEFTEQNLSVYAKNNNIRLYFIFFAGTPDATAKSTLEDMAIATGGFYQRATTAAELDDAYTKIAGALKTEAGVNTKVTLDFGQLIVNNAPAAPGVTIFAYEGDPIIATGLPALPPGSTMLDKYNKTPNGNIDKHLIPGFDDAGFAFPSIGPIITNQTNYWNAHNQQLAFNIGTVNVNETWETSFRLRALTEGNILIFSPLSQVCFDSGEAGPSCMTLPNLSVSSSMNPLNLGLSEKTIQVMCPVITDEQRQVKNTIPFTWTTLYNGAETITEEVSYIHEAEVPVKFDEKSLIPTGGLMTLSSTLSTEKLPPGGYRIQVQAYTNDASVTEKCGPYIFTTQDRPFIRLD